MLFTIAFWTDASQRALRTFAQTMIAGLGGSALNIWSVGWHQVVGLSLGSSLLSILMTIDRSGSPGSTTEQAVKVCGDQLR